MGMKSRRLRSGQSMILVVGGMAALIGMMGMGVDVGSWYVQEQHLQSAMDAAALAAAASLPVQGSAAQCGSPATAAAISAAQQNGFAIGCGNITFMKSNPNQNDQPYDQVKVSDNIRAPAYFSRVFGITSIPESAAATAENTYSSGFNYAVIMLNPNSPLYIQGHTRITGGAHSNDPNNGVQIGDAASSVDYHTDTPNILLPPLTWKAIQSFQPTYYPDGDRDGDASQGDPELDGEAVTFSGSSPALPGQGQTLVVEGNVTLKGTDFSGTIIAWGGNITLDGNNTVGSLIAMQGNASSSAVGNLYFNGANQVNGILWAQNNATFNGQGNQTITGTLAAYNVTLNGDVAISWNSQVLTAIKTSEPWLVP